MKFFITFMFFLLSQPIISFAADNSDNKIGFEESLEAFRDIQSYKRRCLKQHNKYIRPLISAGSAIVTAGAASKFLTASNTLGQVLQPYQRGSNNPNDGIVKLIQRLQNTKRFFGGLGIISAAISVGSIALEFTLNGPPETFSKGKFFGKFLGDISGSSDIADGTLSHLFSNDLHAFSTDFLSMNSRTAYTFLRDSEELRQTTIDYAKFISSTQDRVNRMDLEDGSCSFRSTSDIQNESSGSEKMSRGNVQVLQ